MKLIKKVWGWELILVSTELYTCKLLLIKEGYQCSIHHHKLKDETFVFLLGDAYLDLFEQNNITINGRIRYDLKFGKTYRVKPFTKHRFLGKSIISLMLEVSTEDHETDSYRDTESGKISS